jgi:hypothetical protein
MKTDADLDRESVDMIADMLGRDHGQIDILAQAGVVLLSGHVERLTEKWLAEYLTRSIYGVRATINHIVVGGLAANLCAGAENAGDSCRSVEETPSDGHFERSSKWSQLVQLGLTSSRVLPPRHKDTKA